MTVGERGEKYQGKPCKRGHPGTRYRSSGGCVDCSREDTAKRNAVKALPPPATPPV
jgi:hypothetical protein